MDALTPEQRAEMATGTERLKSLQTKLREPPEDPEDEPCPPKGHPYRSQILAVETREQFTELLREIQSHGYYVGLEDKEATEERLRNSIGRLFYIQNHVTSDYTESGTLDADLAFFTGVLDGVLRRTKGYEDEPLWSRLLGLCLEWKLPEALDALAKVAAGVIPQADNNLPDGDTQEDVARHFCDHVMDLITRRQKLRRSGEFVEAATLGATQDTESPAPTT